MSKVLRASRGSHSRHSQPQSRAIGKEKPLTKKQVHKPPISPAISTSRAPKKRQTVSPQANAYEDHLFQTFQSLKFCRSLPPRSMYPLRERLISFPKRPGYERKKTIVFDLDETLVHCLGSDLDSAAVVLPLRLPSGEVTVVGLNIRPFARECLYEANRHFEVIVFTASQKCYADVVLDYLDPSGALIHHRLYRENCLNIAGVHVKDLRILAKRHLEDIVLVDNAAYSFGYQLDNGIPIVSWTDDPKDEELFNLVDFMKVLACAEDVRTVLRRTFRLSTFYEEYLAEYLNRPRKGLHNLTGR